MSQGELLIYALRSLETLGIPAMLVGSHASSIHGLARSTHDVDIVIALPLSRVSEIVALFPADQYYINESAAVEAVREFGMFNVIHYETNDKVDFWILKPDAFSQSQFLRRRYEPFEGQQIPVCTPEDTILQKLHWSKLCGGSEKQTSDARAVFEIQHPRLDIGYIEHWAREIGVYDEWRAVRASALIDGSS